MNFFLTGNQEKSRCGPRSGGRSWGQRHVGKQGWVPFVLHRILCRTWKCLAISILSIWQRRR